MNGLRIILHGFRVSRLCNLVVRGGADGGGGGAGGAFNTNVPSESRFHVFGTNNSQCK